MRHVQLLAITLNIVLAFWVMPLGIANAQKAQTIAFLDLGKVLNQSLAMKDVAGQIKVIESKTRDEGVARETALREEQDALNRQRAILAPEAFREKQKKFNAKALDFRNEMQAKLKQLALSRAKAVEKIEKTMEPIVSKIAKTSGATMILEKKQILFGETKLDITDKIIIDLNKKLKTVKVKLVPLAAK